MEAITKTEEPSGSGVPAVQSMGTAPADIQVSESDNKKLCPHRYAGCISQQGYMCMHNGPCEPVDPDSGSRFTISYIVEHGQKFMVKDYGKKKVLPLIDADLQQAAATMRQAEAAIASTTFGDVEPFNPAKFCQDVIGS